MMRQALFFAFLLLSGSGLNGQPFKDTVFHHPLDIPVALAATFAELRANHFHAGIDYRTQGVTGHKVYAAADGYVSRIKVEPGGYGKALYLTHPNGYTTVYAHLEAFYDEAAAYVKQQQYLHERFSVDLFPDTAAFPIKRGQQIAVSGNTGSSGGPHLHFELRETKTETPVNPLQFGFGVKDNRAPVMHQLAVYPVGEGSTVNGSSQKLILPLENTKQAYRIQGNLPLHIKGQAAFGIDADDKISGSENRCGLYQLQLLLDSTVIFSQTMDKFSFGESRYINSLIDYAYFVDKKVRFNRLYIEPNNRLSVYDKHINRGILSFPDSAKHAVSVLAKDIHGNSSRLHFSFNYAPAEKTATQMVAEMVTMPDFSANAYEKDVTYQRPGIKITIPANALYDDIRFTYDSSKKKPALYSDIHRVHNRFTPLHIAITLEIAADSLPERLHGKALVVQVGQKGGLTNAGGAYRDACVTTTTRTFGDFAIAVDTIPPRIVPINIPKDGNMQGFENIRFKITDDLSGIATYNGWIDGQWALFEYDAKKNVISYAFDADRLKKDKTHSLLLRVTDAKDNSSEYKAKINY